MTTRFDVYAVGNALVDLEYRVDDAFLQAQGIEKGVMTLAEADAQARLLNALDNQHTREKQASGGSAANSIIAASAFGSRCFYSCKVAADSLGDFYRRDLIAAGVNTNLQEQRPEGVSGTCVVMVTPDSERTMNTYLGITADVSTSELDLDALRASRWLYIEGYLSTSESARAAVAVARTEARAAGVKLALTFSDPAMVQYFQPQLRELLGDGVDLLFCNEWEAKSFAGSDDLDTALAALRQVAQMGVLTRGAEGAWAWTQQSILELPAVAAKAIDTLGAGDSVAGAVLHGLSQGWTLEQSTRLALKTASAVVSQYGPRLPLAQYRELLEA
ncbi:MAG: adenosine kinase [Pseudomonadota bacterium]